MEHIQDCISRQLCGAIARWYDNDGKVYVGRNEEGSVNHQLAWRYARHDVLDLFFIPACHHGLAEQTPD